MTLCSPISTIKECQVEDVIQEPLIHVKENNDKTVEPSKQHILWENVIIIALLHLIAVYGFVINITQMKILTVLWTLVLGMWAMLGITGGVHRLWSHKAYKAKAPMRLILMIGYAIAAEYNPWHWVLYHRVHHKFSDTDADPHNARRGLFYSHLGWLMMSKHPELVKQEKRINMSDIVQDKIFMFFTKYYPYLSLSLGFILPTVIPMLCWNESFYCALSCQLFRYICDTNFAASINSFTHKYGCKPYKSDILPTEMSLASFVTLGEGWHNYHHTFPWDYKAGELGNFKVNLTTTFINLCAKVGWAYDLKEASPNLISSVSKRHGDGTYQDMHIEENFTFHNNKNHQS